MQYKYDISVIIPTYNQEQFIHETIESVLNQKFNGDYEILISDDGSTDNTWDIVNRFHWHKNIRTNRFNQNTQYKENYNWLIQNASGKYIAQLDGDDLFYEDKLQTCFDILESDPSCNVVFHKMNVEKRDGSIHKNFENEDLTSDKYDVGFFLKYLTPFGNSSKVYRANCAMELRGDLTDWQNFDYWIHLMNIGTSYARVVSNQELGLYRMHGRSAGKLFEQKIIKIFEYFIYNKKQYKAEIAFNLSLLLMQKIKNRQTISRKEVVLLFKIIRFLKVREIPSALSFLSAMKLKSCKNI